MQIKQMLGIVGFLAVGFGAIRQPTLPWMVWTISVMLAALAFYTVYAVSLRDQRRLFAIGFSVGGWLYLGLLHLGFEHAMATTWASQMCYQQLHEESEQPEMESYQGFLEPRATIIFFASSPSKLDVSQIGKAQAQGRGMPGGGGYGGYGGGGGGYGGYGGGGGGYGGYGGGGGGYSGYGGGGGNIRPKTNGPPTQEDLSRPMLTPYQRYMHITHAMWTIVVATILGVVAARPQNVRGK